MWEGVIGYIDHAVIDRSLGFMAHVGGPGTRAVFTYGANTFEPDSAEARTRRAGFQSCEERSGDEIWRRYLPGEPHPNAGFTRIGTALV